MQASLLIRAVSNAKYIKYIYYKLAEDVHMIYISLGRHAHFENLSLYSPPLLNNAIKEF